MDVTDAVTGQKLFRTIKWDRKIGEPFEFRVVSEVITPEMVRRVVDELHGRS